MIIETISIDTFISEGKNMKALEGQWVVEDFGPNLEQLKASFDSQKEAFGNETYSHGNNLNWDEVVERLKEGKSVRDGFSFYRIKTDLPKCPRCGSSYEEGTEALSRKDNLTYICSDCGVAEAFEH